MKIKIDKDCCVGCGSCALIAPNTFKISDEDSKAIVVNSEGDSEEIIDKAIDSCALACISKE